MHMLLTLDGINVTPNCNLALIDVEALYSNIPHHIGLQIIESFIIERGIQQHDYNHFILDMLRFYTWHFCVQWLQLSPGAGGCVGNPVWPIVWQSVTREWECWLFASGDMSRYFHHIDLWRSYSDDIFILWTGPVNLLQEFIDKLNINTSNLQFTFVSDFQQIAFLDLLIYKGPRNILVTTLYHKTTATNALLQA